jgi:hypothetical protein
LRREGQRKEGKIKDNAEAQRLLSRAEEKRSHLDGRAV